MCLKACHRFPKIAKEPIVVIKLVRKKEGDNFIPYYINHSNRSIKVNQDHIYELGKREKVRIYKFCLFNLISPIFNKLVGAGFIHSVRYPPEKFFKTGSIRNDLPLLSILNSNPSARYLKCVIPKNSWYYVSEDGEYASRSIIPIEDITEKIKDTFYGKRNWGYRKSL